MVSHWTIVLLPDPQIANQNTVYILELPNSTWAGRTIFFLIVFNFAIVMYTRKLLFKVANYKQTNAQTNTNLSFISAVTAIRHHNEGTISCMDMYSCASMYR